MDCHDLINQVSQWQSGDLPLQEQAHWIPVIARSEQSENEAIQNLTRQIARINALETLRQSHAYLLQSLALHW